MKTAFVACALAPLSLAAPFGYDGSSLASLSARSSVVTPKVKGTPQMMGLVGDPALNRDSCGSARFADRALWTFRDTQTYGLEAALQILPVMSSTASWTNFDAAGYPAINQVTANLVGTIALEQYGSNSSTEAFYPYLYDECGAPSGSCGDGTRYAIWPDSPPLVSETTSSKQVTAYTWIRRVKLDKNSAMLVTNPATTLYRLDYTQKDDDFADAAQLPTVSVVQETFWADGEFAFGAYGNVVRNGIAYLFAQAGTTVALAKVPVDKIEDTASYQYRVNGAWTSQKPEIGQDGVNIANAGSGGQGTFYYSEAWQCFVWIGGSAFPGANAFITTAPSPAGPWIVPIQIYSGPVGDFSLGAYSIQAHPALISGASNSSMFVTYTKNDLDSAGNNIYTTPLVYIEFE